MRHRNIPMDVMGSFVFLFAACSSTTAIKKEGCATLPTPVSVERKDVLLSFYLFHFQLTEMLFTVAVACIDLDTTFSYQFWVKLVSVCEPIQVKHVCL